MKKSFRLSLLALLAVLALTAAACGAEDDASAPLAPAGSDEPAVLPPNSNPDATPPDAGGTCLADEPDCQDLGPGQDPTDLPDSDGTPITPTGMPADGGLTVTDALASDVAGTLAVQGFLLVNAEEARLCEALAESYPPQCGGTSIVITGYEEMVSVPVVNAQGISWTDDLATFFGEIVDGTLVVDPTVTG
ncbi:MAG: hypothetical protein ACR2OI_11155 [Acidimicrobiia bacterium]